MCSLGANAVPKDMPLFTELLRALVPENTDKRKARTAYQQVALLLTHAYLCAA